MDNYLFYNATGYSFAQLSELHNASFNSDFFPLTMNPKMNADVWRVNQIDANLCIIMQDQAHTFMGMTLIGTRGKRGWCSGFGIVPQFRGQGIGKLLAAKMVQVAQANGLVTLQLEVLTQNVAAIKTYESAGFVSIRQLFGLEITTQDLPKDGILQSQVFASDMLLPWLQNADRPNWGRELSTFLSMDTEAVIATGPDGRMNGLLVQRLRLGELIRIHGTVLQSSLTDAQLAALLRQAAGNAKQIQLFNEPEGSPFLARCRQLGFQEFVSQYEMFRALSA